MTQPLVSVVLPTYKRAHLLAQAIRSVLDQTHANLELIVVDDNSPDDTAAVVQSFEDPRIRYVKNDPNLKLPKTLNKGFSLARGDYLTWTSDDNLLAPMAIEKMVGELAAGDCDFVYADYWLFSEQDANGRPLAPQHDRLPDTLQLDKGNHIGACFMYTRKLYEGVGDYDPELFLVEDYDYFLRAARQFRFCHLAEPLYYFRRDDATLYCSRFPEVKASDVLVRFKNGVIDADTAAEILANLLLQHPAELKDAGLRRALAIRQRASYRLGAWLVERGQSKLRSRLAREIEPLFARYQSSQSSFGDTRAALLNRVGAHGTLAYIAPRT
ncbi:glycosyltransferase family 2 protein [Candidatus Nitrotoga sp. 1052]|uniref:glycosyltransferase family 2 protein n=1 Tax=Candidatus Nitrotoga sp. 1052 TaxID=2886964 RepID=UPI001EF4C795|nr:glycosyltransferase [Candidatus Nitrotoga sp. 1052]CAH1087226.1 Glyco_trans_2-like domain-containing protein [Candidatus Nitrotoga sp. 1052]